MKMHKIACAILSVWVLLGIAAGQTTSRMTGVVRDASGALVAGAEVTLTNDATGVAFHTRTTSAGTYVFDAVKPGVYSVQVVAKGFKTVQYKNNVVTIGQPSEANVTLAVGAVNETVEVHDAAELVQTATSGNIGNLVDTAALNSLPIVTTRGRNTLSLVELEPGVIDAGGFNQGGPNVAGGGVHANGARDRAWNYTLDGIDINETSSGGGNFSPLRTNPDMTGLARNLEFRCTGCGGLIQRMLQSRRFPLGSILRRSRDRKCGKRRGIRFSR